MDTSPCTVCGKQPGQCVETRDAGNFLIRTFATDDGPSHTIPAKDLHKYDHRIWPLRIEQSPEAEE